MSLSLTAGLSLTAILWAIEQLFLLPLRTRSSHFALSLLYHPSPQPRLLRAACCNFRDLPPDVAKGPIAEWRLGSKDLEEWGRLGRWSEFLGFTRRGKGKLLVVILGPGQQK